MKKEIKYLRILQKEVYDHINIVMNKLAELKSERIKDVKKGKPALGKKDFLKYLKGKSVLTEEAINAKCYDCMNGYRDGIIDCKTILCPLYPFHPYNNLKEKSKEASLFEKMEKAVKIMKESSL